MVGSERRSHGRRIGHADPCHPPPLSTHHSALTRPTFPWRGFVLGLLLIPANAYFIMDGLMSGQTRPTTVSLFVNVVFSLFVVCLTNMAVARIAPRFALRSGDLALLYVMLSIGGAMSSLDFMQPLVSIIAHPFWFASPENKWKSLFLGVIARPIAVKDLKVLEGFHGGHSSFYQDYVLEAWLAPCVAWGAFIVVLSFAMLCVNAVVRKDWVEHAKLSFPIIQLPLEMTDDRFRLFRSKLMWGGFAVGSVFDFINGIHARYPAFPGLGGQFFDLSTVVRNPPWNAIAWTPIGLFPFALGLGFFIPLDLSFSCWFFYLFWKAERVLSTAAGYGQTPRFPLVEEQCFAGFVAFCLSTLWLSRGHLRSVWGRVLGRTALGDAEEALGYRVAVLGFAAALLALTVFSLWIGMSWWAATVFLVLYMMVSTAVSRLRAELGSPVHDLHLSAPHLMMVNALGSKALGVRNLTAFSFYQFFNRAYRGHEMPHQLEGMKLCGQTGVHLRHVSLAIMVAVALGAAAGFWGLLDVSYRYAARSGYGVESFGRLQTWLTQPTGPDLKVFTAMGVGFAQTVALMAMRYRFARWPLHPAGLIVSGSWSMNLFWVSLFFAWAIKSCLFRYAGIQSYRKAMPFFMGLILGEYTMGTLWSLYGIIIHMPMYNFLP